MLFNTEIRYFNEDQISGERGEEISHYDYSLHFSIRGVLLMAGKKLLLRPEFTWRTAIPSLEGPVEIGQIIKPADETYL